MPPFNTPNAENLLLGKGQVLFDRFDSAGLSTGYKHLGNVERFELTTSDDMVEKRSSMTAAAPMLKRVNRARTISLAMTLDEFHPDNLALALMGTSAVLVQAATAVVGEALAPTTVPGSFVKLAKLGPYTAGPVVKFGAGAGVLGTDYQIISAKGGIIQILPGTALTGAVTADYTPTAYTAITGPKVVGGGNAAQITGRLLFLGDPSAGPAQMVEVWRVSISPSGALEYISDDYATMELTGTVTDDSALHPANPMFQSTFLP